jgi:hypothetical protein
MKANSIPVRVSNEGHPTNPGLNRVHEHFDFVMATGVDRSMDVGYGQGDCRRALPGSLFFSAGPIQAKSYWFGGKFCPEIGPFLSALQTK